MFRVGGFLAFLSALRVVVGGSPLVRSCDGVQSSAGGLGLPETVLAEERGEEAGESVHDIDGDDLFRC